MPLRRDGEDMSYGPYPWIYPRVNTSNQIARQSESTYLDYEKIKAFEDVGYFLISYVVSGGVTTKNITYNNQADVSEIVVSIADDVMHRDGTNFITEIPSTTYFLDFTKEGDFHWGTSHPSGTINVDYVAVAEVNTDSSGNISTIVDKASPRGGFRLKSEYGLEGYLLRDGTLPMTGNLNMDSHKVVNLTAPTIASDAARKDTVDNAITALSNSSSKFLFGDNQRGSLDWTLGVTSIGKAGFYYIESDTSGLPIAANGYVIHHQYPFDDGTALQIYSPSNIDRIWIRRKFSGTWGDWVEFITSLTVFKGVNSPEGTVTAPIGSLFLRSNGGANTSLYVKESGTGNLGWMNK